MSNIAISDLRQPGSELFTDSESFMNELVTNELNSVVGGLEKLPIPVISPICFCFASFPSFPHVPLI